MSYNSILLFGVMLRIPPEADEALSAWLEEVLDEYLKRSRCEAVKAAMDAVTLFSGEVTTWIQRIENQIKDIKVRQPEARQERCLRASTPDTLTGRRKSSQIPPVSISSKFQIESKKKVLPENKKKPNFPSSSANLSQSFSKVHPDIKAVETRLKEIESDLHLQIKKAEEDKKIIASHKERIAALEASKTTIRRSSSFDATSSKKWLSIRKSSIEKNTELPNKSERILSFTKKERFNLDVDLIDFDFTKNFAR